ncbi:translation initiation factor IF-2 [Emticicia sp. SJ17W-69]|uniref:translation initiation factor IF-2 n=1 Tax=Emticicia sp. SJ17W-69 TaxID=3421657 RepID=UPI003EBE6860
MTEQKEMRLSLAAKKLNVGIVTIVEKLAVKGIRIENNPNAKLNSEQLNILSKEYNNTSLLEDGTAPKSVEENKASSGNSDILYFRDQSKVEEKKVEPVVEKTPIVQAEPEVIRVENKLQGVTILGKIDLDKKPTPPPVEPVKVEPVVVAPKVEQKISEVETPKPVVVEQPKVVVETPKEPVKAEPVVEIAKTPIVVEAPKPVVEAPKAIVEEVKPVAETPKPVVEESKPVVELPKVEVPKVVVEPPKFEQKPNEQRRQQEPQRQDNRPPYQKQDNQQRPQGQGQQRPQGQGGQPQQRNDQRPPHKAEQRPVPPPPPKKEIPIIEDFIEPELIQARGEKLQGLKVLGRIELPVEKKALSNEEKRKRKRKRVKRGEKVNSANGDVVVNKPKTSGPAATGVAKTTESPKKADVKKKKERREEVSQVQVKEQIKQTMARMQTKGPDFGAKYRKDKRKSRADQEEQRVLQEQEESNILKVTEFISAAELASLMDVSVTEVISAAMKMGMFVSINQRLDAEAIQMLALDFDYDVQFISAEEEIKVDTIEKEDADEDLLPRAPIVTIMGHVDHGKTSLLDYIRRTKVASGEAGGITQHIGAYDVEINEGPNKGKKISFLDTPGHEAFTAMRARGAKVTDIVIVVVAADDSVMPQTREAINHAQNAGVPIVFAINKIDKVGANPAKIREDLAKENILVESWGGKYQEQEVSAKKGIGINELLDKVLLEAELLDLKANPDRTSVGTVVEASLDKGRGYVTTVLVQNGTLKVGDVILAGQYFGRVKAMVDATGARIKSAGPSTPVQVLGLPGAPQAGDRFNVMDTEREARDIANKREQIHREQSIRAKKHITLEEIGRRKAIGTFHQLNVIVKGDVDGSVEALSDSLLKLSTDEVQVAIIHKGVGQISESDVLLASTADAIVIGFQVRPSTNARKIADQEEIEIRLYSIIYDAINEIRDAMEGLLAPKEEETIVGTIEVREVFKISKVGTIAGCYVTDGNFKRNNKVRLIRDGIVIHEGEIQQLKRFKDDVNEVKYGFECGMSLKGFNEIEVGDTLESFEIKEVKRKL